MSYPTLYPIDYSYTGFAAGLGDGSFPGSQLDNDLAGLIDVQRSMAAFLTLALRSDGKLANQSVGPDQISPALSIGFTNRGTWRSDAAYNTGDGVALNEKFYSARVAHTSSALTSPDVDVDTWMELFSFASIVIGDGTITPAKLDATEATGFRTAIAAAAASDLGTLTSTVSALDTAKVDKSSFPATTTALDYLRRNAANTAWEKRTAAQVAADILPAGFVMFSPKGSVSDGWLACEGGTFSQIDYPALYAYLGNSTTLPDYRDRVLRGAGTLAGAVYTTQEDAFQAHTRTSLFATIAGSASGANGALATNATGSAGQGPLANAVMTGYGTDGANGTPRTAAETRVKAAIGKYVIKAH